MRKNLLLGFFFLYFSPTLFPQCGGPGGVDLTVQNPSFEGPSQAHVVPAPWQACYGTPDTQPGQWGITQAPSDGSGYISALQGGNCDYPCGYSEGASQQLSSCMVAGTTYSFSLDLAFSPVYNTASPGNCYGSLRIMGGNSMCGQNEILWQSGMITNTAWQTYTISLTPTQNWCYISMRPYFISSCSGYINIMIDNLGPIVAPGPSLQASVNSDISCSQTINGTISCPPNSVILSGLFNGSSTNATILTDSTWTQNVTYPPGSAGTQNIFITAYTQTGDTLSDTITFNLVEVNPQFTAPGVCYGTPTTFTDNSTITSGSIVSWLWDFGDGFGTSNAQNPTYSYAFPGNYSVKLIVTSDLGCTDSITKIVRVFPNPVADFSTFNVCLNSLSQFDNTSFITSGTLASFNWDFGDGSGTSVTINPAYTYLNPGTYNVTLTVVSDSGCSASIVKQTVVHPLPSVNFSALNVCLYDSVVFQNTTNISSGNILSYNWNFGDAGTSSQINPSHVYPNPGNYLVALTAVSDSGCSEDTSKNIVINPVPFAGFSANNVCAYSSASFINSSVISSGNIVSYDWYFGDGSANSSLQNPTHQYNAFGVYNVQLIAVSDSGCSDTVSQQVEIYAVPSASFLVQNVCRYDSALFVNTSTIGSGNVVSWNWNFGDGGSSLMQFPSHLYASAGNFSVQLVVTSDNGCTGTVAQPLTVYPVPVSDFSASNACAYDSAYFFDASAISSGSVVSYLWDFGDGAGSSAQNPSHLYSSANSFDVELRVTSDNGCVDSVTKLLTIYPVPQADFTFDSDICLYEAAQFNSSNSSVSSGTITSYSWNFGDGNTSLLPNPSHNYGSPLTFAVGLLVISDFGCRDSVTKFINIHPAPLADFSFFDSCVYDTAHFTDLSTVSPGNISGWNWNFGDGDSSSQQHNTHLYAQAGVYSVALIVTSAAGCKDTAVKTIERYPKPVANFTSSSVCLNEITDFNNLSTVLNINGDFIATYLWSFGDGSPFSSAQNPSHTYASSGSFNANLIVITNNNCIHDTILPVVVHPLPTADFSNTSVCRNQPPTLFSDISLLANSWSWNFGDGSNGTDQNPSHTYLTHGLFNVQLVVTTDKGCKDSVIKQVKVHPLPLLAFTANTAGCEPFCTQFFETAITLDSASITAIKWNFGDGNFSTGSLPVNCFMNEGKYSVSFMAFTSDGCSDTLTKADFIRVWPKPVAEFDFAPSSVSVFHPKYSFTDLSSGATQWYWDFGDGQNSLFQNPVHEYSDSGWYTVTQIVTNFYYCQDTIEYSVYVKPEFSIYVPNAFTPDDDGINDVFFPKGIGIVNEDYSFFIFDRWGDLIFETYNLKGFWDGTHKGNPAKQDVYVYRIIAKDVFGELHRLSGSVTLIR